MSEEVTPASTQGQAHMEVPVTPQPAKAAPTSESAPEPGNEATIEPKVDPDSVEHEFTIDGKKVRMSLSEMKRRVSLENTAQSRFEEAAKMRKQAESLLGRLKSPKDAIKLLQDPSLGLNQEEIRSAFEEWYADTFIKREQMTPEEREMADIRAENEAYRKEKEAQAQRQREEQEEQQTKEMTQRVQKEIISLIEQNNLPKTRFTAGRIAHWYRVNELKGIQSTPDLILHQVRNEQSQVMKDLVENGSGEHLFNALGETAARKLAKYFLEQVRKGNAPKTPAVDPFEAPKPKGRITEAEFKRNLRNWK